MKHISLIPISGKPVHHAHWKLIEMAANENDLCIPVISLADRKRPGEFPINGSDMAKIWKECLIEHLPTNCKAVFTKDGSPVKVIYALLGESERSNINECYVIYSGPDDMNKNFRQENLFKYYPKLIGEQKIKLNPVDRKNLAEISGTKMREFLKNNNKEEFLNNLPGVPNKEKMWDILAKTDWLYL